MMPCAAQYCRAKIALQYSDCWKFHATLVLDDGSRCDFSTDANNSGLIANYKNLRWPPSAFGASCTPKNGDEKQDDKIWLSKGETSCHARSFLADNSLLLPRCHPLRSSPHPMCAAPMPPASSRSASGTTGFPAPTIPRPLSSRSGQPRRRSRFPSTTSPARATVSSSRSQQKVRRSQAMTSSRCRHGGLMRMPSNSSPSTISWSR